MSKVFIKYEKATTKDLMTIAKLLDRGILVKKRNYLRKKKRKK